MCERRVNIDALFRDAALRCGDPTLTRMPYTIDDRGSDFDGVYAMCYNATANPSGRNACGPDWTFHGWPAASIESFERVTAQIEAAGAENEPRIRKVGWFGNVHSPMSGVPEHRTRPLLKAMGDMRPDVLDIVHVGPENSRVGVGVPRYVSLPDHTHYAGLLDIGGNGYSGRLKYLLFSGRPLLLVARDYVEYFHVDMVPNVHYVPVKQDLSDLVDRVEWLLTHEAEGRLIAQNALAFAKERFTRDKILDRICEVHRHLSTF